MKIVYLVFALSFLVPNLRLVSAQAQQASLQVEQPGNSRSFSANYGHDLRCLQGIVNRNDLASGTNRSILRTFLSQDGWTDGGAILVSGDRILVPERDQNAYLLISATASSRIRLPVADPANQEQLVQIEDFYLRVFRHTFGPPTNRRFIQAGTTAEKQADIARQIQFNEEQERKANEALAQAQRARQEGRTEEAAQLEAIANVHQFLRMRVDDMSGVPMVVGEPIERDEALQLLHRALVSMIATVRSLQQRWYNQWIQENEARPANRREAQPRPGSLEDANAAIAALRTCTSVESRAVTEAARTELAHFKANNTSTN